MQHCSTILHLARIGGAVLRVLLVLRVEVVDGVRHDVPRVHRLPGGRVRRTQWIGTREDKRGLERTRQDRMLPEGGRDGGHGDSPTHSWLAGTACSHVHLGASMH